MMKTKNRTIKFFAIAILVLISAQITLADSSSQSLAATLSVSGLQYLPNPAVPGQYLDVYINVQNNKATADSVQCELRPEYPFSLDPNDMAGRLVGSLGAGQNAVLKYKVRVDSGAVLGDNTLKFACKTSDIDWIEAKLTISVQTQTRSLVIDKIAWNPPELEPGMQGVMTVTIKNIAPTPVRDVSVTLDLSSDATPLAPIESATEKNIPAIDGNSQVQVQFNLVSLADAAAKAYKIPLRISFKDYLGNAYTLNDTAGVILNSKPTIEAYVEQSNILRANTAGTVLVKIVNRGLSDAKFVNIIASDGKGVTVVEPNEFYVGTLASDDFDTIEYKLFVANPGTIASFPIQLSYRDANNNGYLQNASVQFALYSDKEISQFGLEPAQGFNWLWIVLIAAIAFVGYWFYWRKRAKT